ncbi:MAG TPA: cytochrome-c oxidase, cbb3-type subunit III [Micropepsaceae bacterium]|nr:cytochrome-c oxidase, cbb3-type subunit III [Micropepsaceae bacterium]
MSTHQDKERDAHSGVETTGHEWDGIKELNNPLPKWWLQIFYATVIISLVYWVLFPAIPLVESATTGVLGQSDRADVVSDLEALRAQRAPTMAKLANAPLEAIEQDPDLLSFVLAAGASVFGDNCAPCHGSGAQGSVGYPNLIDDVWIWGGTLEDIRQTIRYGIRSDHSDTRISEMPAFGRDELLTKEQIADLAQYVLSISGQGGDAAAVLRAQPLFAEQCAVCHGEAGMGMREFGAPNLTDADWVYGGDLAAITETITNARRGVMPAWTGRMDDATINALAIYVHALGGGE